ncbi:MAG: NAD(P)H-hydrate dehydratase [Polymorphobacter sp.]
MLKIAPGPPLVTPAAMRSAEAAAIAAGTPALVLMERACAAAVAAILRFCPGQTALVLCGPGNNGGDGYGVALGLQAAGVAVRVAAAGPARGEPAATMAARWAGPVESLPDAAPAPLIIDALFGTGLARPLPAEVQAAIDRLRGAAETVVAIDIASGVDALTGALLGAPLAADLTVSFGSMKRGQALGQGRQMSGRVVVADIGVAIPAVGATLIAPPQRSALAVDTHKYRRGAVLVVEGDAVRGGAARLTALAALRSGAGVVTLAGPGPGGPADAIMRRSDAEGAAMLNDPRLGAIAIGPGLVDGQRGRDWLARVLAGDTPVVADAGAFAVALGAGVPGAGAFSGARAPLVVTPHEGEFARLFGAIGGDRVGAAQAAAVSSGAIVVLKGPETIVAAPDGRVAINTHAAAWLATAGSGDALTGIIAGLLAQGLASFDAACAAVWLHGDAGLCGGPGMIADEIAALLPQVLAAL